MTGVTPSISVVIPTKDAGLTIRGCLDGIFSQTLADMVDVLVIDSGSTDGTLDILHEYPVRVHHLAPGEFNHGDTRNLGAALARGEFVVFTVQDARPADRHWLERLLQPFDDRNVAGVCGQQIVPHEPDKNPLQWFRPYEDPTPRKIVFATPDDFARLSPAEKVELCGWDDVTAMYRRSALLALPFQRVSFAEDLIWAKDALLRGYAIVYDYSARVYHYHHETFAFRFRREFTILYHRYRHFGYLTLPRWLLPDLAIAVHRAARPKYCPDRRLQWLTYNVKLALAEWSAGWVFWLATTAGAKGAVDRLHAALCATPPQALRTT